METLKIYLILLLSAVFAGNINGQFDSKIMAAFADSYKSELNGNYVMSVSEIKSVYQADNYSMNARLGWLLFLAKQYTESVNYYDKAIKLKPYGIEARFGMIKALNALESWDKVKEQYEAILKNSENTGPLESVGRFGVNYYNSLGYIPYNVNINENVARTLEYSYDDFTIMKLAKALNRPKNEIDRFAKRALNYKNILLEFDKPIYNRYAEM